MSKSKEELSTYEELYQNFDWSQAWEQFKGGKDDWFNLGYEAIGKHAANGLSDEFAVRVVDFEEREAEELTYGELNEQAGQFINFLTGELGLSSGDRIGAMLDASPELYATLFGTLLGGFEFVPLFNLFGPDATNYRLDDANVKAIVTTPKHQNKINYSELDNLEYVILAEKTRTRKSWKKPFEAVYKQDSDYEVAETAYDDTAVIQYTSGTTGQPKGVKIKHSMIVAMYPTFEWSADQRREDNYFGAAPPAWSYGLYGCTCYPLHKGMGTTSYYGEFHPEPFVGALQEYNITNLFGPPTLFRQLSDLDLNFEYMGLNLRHVCSAGEPLDEATLEWSERAFGTKIVDHYGFTEGSMFVCNYTFDDWEIKAGSMGKPVPGYEVELLQSDVDEPVERGEIGEIAIRTNAPFTASEYLNQPEKSKEKWGGEWLRSDDLAHEDEDGYFWFEGRGDDVILSSGYRIGPTEVESTLMKHDSVSEVAVIGLPDQERGEIVGAFIVLDDDYKASEGLKEELQQHVKDKLSKVKYPRRIEFLKNLPTTESEKIQRYRLREDYT